MSESRSAILRRLDLEAARRVKARCNRKLSIVQEREIAELRRGGYTAARLAEDYGVSRVTVHNICVRWR